MILGIILVVAAIVFLIMMKKEPLWEDDKPLKKVDDSHLSFKEKDFYKQILIHKQRDNENNRSETESKRKKRGG